MRNINALDALFPKTRQGILAARCAHTGSGAERHRLGVDDVVSKNVPQQSLRRLQDGDLVLRLDYGDYRLQDDAFAEWLKSHELEG